MVKIPEFKSEREEAGWWDENRHLLEEELMSALEKGAQAEPSVTVQKMAAARGITAAEMQQQIREQRLSAESEVLTKLPRSA